jgi:RecB family exonuclease
VITPRQTRLVRVADLHAFRRAIHTLAAATHRERAAPLVVVPTTAAGAQLKAAEADAVTRDQLYERLHATLDNPPHRLTAIERDVLFQAAASLDGRKVRPGLVAEIVRFYDLLRRHSQQVQRFEALIDERLAVDVDTDRGADRLRDQTHYLAETFREYERRVAASGACDEHTLRERLIAQPARHPIRRLVVTVPDWIADPDGLFVADFDLLARLPGLEQLDIVATEATLGSGFHERLHDWWPGIDEVGAKDIGADRPAVKPMLVTPDANAMWSTVRDREEELIAAATEMVRRGRTPEQTAIVYKLPLPYVYLAADTLGAAGVRFHSADALPLAAEPTIAAADLVLDFVASGFTRAATVALLRCPHFRFAPGGIEVAREHVSALDRELSDTRYLGELARLEQFVHGPVSTEARPAADAAFAAATALAPMAGADAASRQLARVRQFFEAHARPLEEDDPLASRETRARVLLMEGLARLSSAFAEYADPPWTIDDTAAAIRRWIETETFGVDSLPGGVHLLDDRAARYGEFDDLYIVGLIEGDWPEKPRRNIFYPSNLMKALGWPSERDRRAAAEARFIDLIASARERVTLSAFTLEDEALVEPSTLLEEIPRARLSSMAREPMHERPVGSDEAAGALAGTDGWSGPAFHGQTGAIEARAWSVSALETYLGCPFKFFAQHVLKLEEEPDDEEVMDPRKQGQFVHEVFERFFRAWQLAGHGAITPALLGAAREMFAGVVDEAAARLPGAEGALERTRLLGSPAAAGLGDAVFRMEAERPIGVVERLLEHKLEGDFLIATAEGARTIRLRGKADRLDLLADGTFRLIDYKLGWPPDRRKALQLSIYAICAEQRLAGRHGRNWTLSEAVYLAFKGPRRVVPLFQSGEGRRDVLADAQQRMADALDAIARGEFPPTPDDVYRCETCTFAAVCRKDYVGNV